MKVSELTGAVLDCWVAKVEGIDVVLWTNEGPEDQAVCILKDRRPNAYPTHFQPSTSWSQGGPLLDKYQVCIGRGQSAEYPVYRELDDTPIPGARIELRYATARVIDTEAKYHGDDTLIAGMRAIVASVYGPNVPDHPPQEA